MSRASLMSAVALVAAVGFAGCKGASPKSAAEALGLNRDKPSTAQTANQAPEPPKPVPAQLPTVLARVNGHDITKADFDRALKAIEQRAGGPVPDGRRDEVYRNLLEELVRIDLLRQEATARKVAVSDADVDKRMQEVLMQFPSEEVFKQMLAAQSSSIERFRAEQRDTLAIAKMLGDAVSDKIKPTDTQVNEFYKNNPDRFRQGERVRASHILIRVPDGADAAAKAKAREKAEALLKKIKAGGDFAAIAKENSEDPGSAVQGGDLGYFTPGQMVPEFNDVAFKLAPGTVSDLVETQFGFHIIKVVEKQAGHTVSLEEVKPQLTQFLENQNRQRESAAFIAELRAKSKVEILI